MTGAEHYREAERLLDLSGQEAEVDVEEAESYVAFLGVCVARAQVHATLAVAAATALGSEGGDSRLPAKDRAAWFDVASECRKTAAA